MIPLLPSAGLSKENSILEPKIANLESPEGAQSFDEKYQLVKTKVNFEFPLSTLDVSIEPENISDENLGLMPFSDDLIGLNLGEGEFFALDFNHLDDFSEFPDIQNVILKILNESGELNIDDFKHALNGEEIPLAIDIGAFLTKFSEEVEGTELSENEIEWVTNEILSEYDQLISPSAKDKLTSVLNSALIQIQEINPQSLQSLHSRLVKGDVNSEVLNSHKIIITDLDNNKIKGSLFNEPTLQIIHSENKTKITDGSPFEFRPAMLDTMKSSGNDNVLSAKKSLNFTSVASQVETAAIALPTNPTNSVSTELNSRIQMPVQISFGHPQWVSQVAERSAMMIYQKIDYAELQLDPPELGPLQVKVSVQQDSASVSFVTGNAQVKEALELTSMRLRELLEEQSINLLDVNVSDQSEEQSEKEFNDKSNDNAEELAENLSSETTKLESYTVEYGLDFYA